ASVNTRRIDLVLVPRAPAQASGVDKLPLSLDDGVVNLSQSLSIGISHRLLTILLDALCFFRKVVNCRGHRLVVQSTSEIANTSKSHRFTKEVTNLHRVIGVIKRKPIRVCETHRKRAPELSCRDVIVKAGIAEVIHPVERIVGRMVNTVIAVESHVGRCNSEVL